MERKVFENPPTWLNTGWVAEDNGGLWYWHEKKPFVHGKCWLSAGDTCGLSTQAFVFNPPESAGSDWRENCFEIIKEAT